MKTVLLIGAGRMGSAMLKGWLLGMHSPTRFLVLDPHAKPSFDETEDEPQPDHRFQYFRAPPEIPKHTLVDAIVLATKPLMVCESLQSVKTCIGPNTVVVSVAAGISTETICNAIPGKPVTVRIMPNIGAMVGHAVSAGFATDNATGTQRALVQELFSSIGVFSWLESENDLHAVTALSGSGPAYYFAFCEAMIEVSENLGLTAETARNLAVGTVIAAGRLLEHSGDPEQLRRTVTSPNGTTAAGLEVLSHDNTLSNLVRAVLSAARDRSVALA